MSRLTFFKKKKRSLLRRLLSFVNTSDSFSLNRLPEWLIHSDYLLSKHYHDWIFKNPNNNQDIIRLLFLIQVCESIQAENIEGDIAEIGVFRGNSAKIFSNLLPDKKMYLFDTFTGFDDRDVEMEEKSGLKGVFSDNSLEDVKSFLGGNIRINYCRGYFPETADAIDDGQKFSLVHLDADLYAPIKAGLDLFYAKVVKGGWVLIHDYNNPRWKGCKKAVDDFLSNKEERVVHIPDKSGTVAFRKL